MQCPHCAAPLVEAPVEGVPVHACKAHGLLIPQKTFTGIIERSWSAVPKAQALSRVFPPRPDSGPPLSCPACGRTMDRYPYCGIAAIPVDGCPGCRRLWLDKDELETILVAVAKMNHARDDRDRAWEKGRGAAPFEGIQGFYANPRLGATLDPDLQDRRFVERAVAFDLLIHLLF